MREAIMSKVNILNKNCKGLVGNCVQDGSGNPHAIIRDDG